MEWPAMRLPYNLSIVFPNYFDFASLDFQILRNGPSSP